MHLAVEWLMINIISLIKVIDEARDALYLSDGIMFENHANTLTDGNNECV
jgi:hypothetical protein